MSKQSAELFAEVEDLTQTLFEKEEWEEAVYTAQVAVDNSRDLLDGSQTSLKHLINCLELHGKALRMKGSHEDARQEIREAKRVIDHLDRDQLDEEQHARIETSHAVVSDQLGFVDDAITSYKLGVEYYERLDDLPTEEVSDLLNNLAYLYKYQDFTDEAEDSFQKALTLLKKESDGEQTERIANILNNLGALYQHVQDFDRAEDTFKEALVARKKVLGDEHPDTAQTHGNLAIAVASKGNQEEAKEHFDQALKIYSNYVEHFAEDFEIIAENYIDYLEMLEETEKMEEVRKLKEEKLS